MKLKKKYLYIYNIPNPPPVLITSVPPLSYPQVTPELSFIQNKIINIIQPAREKITDQTIDPRRAGNCSGLDRVPDVIRCLRDFSDDTKEFTYWKKSVERILRRYEAERGTPR